MTLAKHLAYTAIDNLIKKSAGFDHWWDDVSPETRDDIYRTLEQVFKDILSNNIKWDQAKPKSTPPDTTRYSYEHTWYDAYTKATLRVGGADTLEQAVNAVMEKAITQKLTPPYWWVKP